MNLKNYIKKICTIVLLCLTQHHTHALQFGTGADQILTAQAISAYISQLNIVPAQPNTIINSCTCPVPPQAIPIALPKFLITMQNYLGFTVNSFTFPTNSNFKSRIAILTVQLFPSSNTVTLTGINTNSADNSFAIVYTLQSHDGVYFQKEIQYPSAAGNQTFMGITNGIPTIPNSITINTSPISATPLATQNIIQSLAGLPVNMQQQIFNSICPITQKFFIATDALGNNPTAIPISGSDDPNSNLTTPVMTTSVVPATVTAGPPIQPTTGTEIANIIVTLYNNLIPYNIIFQQPSATQPLNVSFNELDLINGLLLHLYIFPPLYQNGTTSNTFIFIATLQTLDGLKFLKQVYQGIPFTNLPLNFTIKTSSLAGFTTTVTAAIASPQIVQQLYNMISPTHIRVRLQQDENQVVNITIT